MATITEAMTTRFTPPASCTSQWTFEGQYYNSIEGGLLLQNALPSPLATACFPEDFEGSGRAASIEQIYSPGACPVGYVTGGNTFNGAVTTAVCCPSNFNYFETYTSINFYSTSAKFAGCLSTYPSNAGYTTVLGRTGNDDLNSTSVTGPITMWAQPVSVAIAPSDLSLFTTTTTTSSSSQSTASVGSVPTSTPSSTESAATTTTTPPAASDFPDSASASATASASSNTGLSGGAIAGIAIAAAIIIGALIGLAIFFRRRKNHTQLAAPLTPLPDSEKPSPAEPYTYYAHELPPENAVVEMNGYGQGPYSDHLHEMPGQDKPKGYSHYAQPVELGS